MNQQQIDQLKQIAEQDDSFYLTCKSHAANLQLPYPGQYADRIQSAIAKKRFDIDTERVALEVLRSSAAEAVLDAHLIELRFIEEALDEANWYP